MKNPKKLTRLVKKSLEQTDDGSGKTDDGSGNIDKTLDLDARNEPATPNTEKSPDLSDLTNDLIDEIADDNEPIELGAEIPYEGNGQLDITAENEKNEEVINLDSLVENGNVESDKPVIPIDDSEEISLNGDDINGAPNQTDLIITQEKKSDDVETNAQESNNDFEDDAAITGTFSVQPTFISPEGDTSEINDQNLSDDEIIKRYFKSSVNHILENNFPQYKLIWNLMKPKFRNFEQGFVNNFNENYQSMSDNITSIDHKVENEEKSANLSRDKVAEEFNINTKLLAYLDGLNNSELEKDYDNNIEQILETNKTGFGELYLKTENFLKEFFKFEFGSLYLNNLNINPEMTSDQIKFYKKNAITEVSQKIVSVLQEKYKENLKLITDKALNDKFSAKIRDHLSNNYNDKKAAWGGLTDLFKKEFDYFIDKFNENFKFDLNDDLNKFRKNYNLAICESKKALIENVEQKYQNEIKDIFEDYEQLEQKKAATLESTVDTASTKLGYDRPKEKSGNGLFNGIKNIFKPNYNKVLNQITREDLFNPEIGYSSEIETILSNLQKIENIETKSAHIGTLGDKIITEYIELSVALLGDYKKSDSNERLKVLSNYIGGPDHIIESLPMEFYLRFLDVLNYNLKNNETIPLIGDESIRIEELMKKRSKDDEIDQTVKKLETKATVNETTKIVVPKEVFDNNTDNTERINQRSEDNVQPEIRYKDRSVGFEDIQFDSKGIPITDGRADFDNYIKKQKDQAETLYNLIKGKNNGDNSRIPGKLKDANVDELLIPYIMSELKGSSKIEEDSNEIFKKNGSVIKTESGTIKTESGSEAQIDHTTEEKTEEQKVVEVRESKKYQVSPPKIPDRSQTLLEKTLMSFEGDKKVQDFIKGKWDRDFLLKYDLKFRIGTISDEDALPKFIDYLRKEVLKDGKVPELRINMEPDKKIKTNGNGSHDLEFVLSYVDDPIIKEFLQNKSSELNLLTNYNINYNNISSSDLKRENRAIAMTIKNILKDKGNKKAYQTFKKSKKAELKQAKINLKKMRLESALEESTIEESTLEESTIDESTIDESTIDESTLDDRTDYSAIESEPLNSDHFDSDLTHDDFSDKASVYRASKKEKPVKMGIGYKIFYGLGWALSAVAGISAVAGFKFLYESIVNSEKANSLKLQNVTYHSKLGITNDAINTLIGDITSTDEKINGINNLIESFKSGEQKNQIQSEAESNYKGQLADKKRKVNKIKTNLEILTNSYHAKLDKLKTKFQAQNSKEIDYSSKIDDLKSELNGLKSKYNSEKSELKNELRQLETNLKEQKNKYNSIQKAYYQKVAISKKLKADIGNLEDKVGSLKSKYDKIVNQEIVQDGREIREIEDKEARINKEIADAESYIQKIQPRSRGHSPQARKYLIMIKRTQAFIDEKKNELDKLPYDSNLKKIDQETINNNQLNNLETKIKVNSKRIDEKKKDLEKSAPGYFPAGELLPISEDIERHNVAIESKKKEAKTLDAKYKIQKKKLAVQIKHLTQSSKNRRKIENNPEYNKQKGLIDQDYKKEESKLERQIISARQAYNELKKNKIQFISKYVNDFTISEVGRLKDDLSNLNKDVSKNTEELLNKQNIVKVYENNIVGNDKRVTQCEIRKKVEEDLAKRTLSLSGVTAFFAAAFFYSGYRRKKKFIGDIGGGDGDGNGGDGNGGDGNGDDGTDGGGNGSLIDSEINKKDHYSDKNPQDFLMGKDMIEAKYGVSFDGWVGNINDGEKIDYLLIKDLHGLENKLESKEAQQIQTEFLAYLIKNNQYDPLDKQTGNLLINRNFPQEALDDLGISYGPKIIEYHISFGTSNALNEKKDHQNNVLSAIPEEIRQEYLRTANYVAIKYSDRPKEIKRLHNQLCEELKEEYGIANLVFAVKPLKKNKLG